METLGYHRGEILSVCATPELLRGLENVIRAYVDKVVSRKWVNLLFCVNCPFKEYLPDNTLSYHYFIKLCMRLVSNLSLFNIY